MADAKKSGKKAPPTDVESYLATVPSEAVAALRALRKAIRQAAPDAEEVISYGVPTYKYRGALVSFSATPRHCAFYVMSPGPIAARKEELKAYDTAPSAIRFPAGQPLPATLVKAIVKERMKEDDAK
jgi:uncharacterized protein YdhG (YjbR/CyaY superfamily)